MDNDYWIGYGCFNYSLVVDIVID